MKRSTQALIKNLFVKKAHVDANVKFDRDIGNVAEQTNEHNIDMDRLVPAASFTATGKCLKLICMK